MIGYIKVIYGQNGTGSGTEAEAEVGPEVGEEGFTRVHICTSVSN